MSNLRNVIGSLNNPWLMLVLWSLWLVLTAPVWLFGAWYIQAVALAVALYLGLLSLDQFDPRSTQLADIRRWLAPTGLGLLIFAGIGWQFLPQAGLTSLIQTNDGVLLARRTAAPGFLPDQWLDAAESYQPMILEQHGWLNVPAELNDLRFSTTHGTGVLLLDEREVAVIHPESTERLKFVDLSGKAGLHKLDLRVETAGPVPNVGLQLSRIASKQVADPQLHFSPEPYSGWALRQAQYLRTALQFCFGLGALFLLGAGGLRGGHWIPRARDWHPVWWKAVAVTALVLVLICGYRALLIHRSGGVLDADEAAFGIMAQRLLEGEFPPLFHYAQSYQGTLESWPLAFLFHLAGAGVQTMRWHSVLWYLLGAAFLLMLAAREYSKREWMILGLYLVVSPQMLAWMSTKAWFGYDSTWAMGAMMGVLSVSLAHRPDGRGWRWAVLGFLFGVAFYTLPLVAPFILACGIVVLRYGWRQLAGWSGLAVIGGTIAGLFPMILYDIATGGLALQYVLHGRELGDPRLPGERGFWDRFLGECLPVLLGTRPIHQDQYEHIPAFAAQTLYLLLGVGVVGHLPRMWNDAKAFIRGDALTVRFFFTLLGLASIAVVVRSRFGIVPWYFLALYPLLALIVATGIDSLARRIPLTAPAAVLFLLWANAYSTLSVAEVMHHPTSLLKEGVLPAENHQAVIAELERRDIHTVICDQGMEPVGGRNWLDERLTFESGGDINGVDTFTRRHPHLAWRLHRSPRTAYLVPKNFLWWDADLSRIHEADKFPMTYQRLANLFGPEFADYERVEIGNYSLFVPQTNSLPELKPYLRVEVTASPHIQDRLLDGEIGSRDLAKCSWGTGRGQAAGDFIAFDLGAVRPLRRLVLYHGIKGFDRSGKTRVEISLDGTQWDTAGYLLWYADPNASVWNAALSLKARYIRVVVEEARPEAWWTVYEAWVL